MVRRLTLAQDIRGSTPRIPAIGEKFKMRNLTWNPFKKGTEIKTGMLLKVVSKEIEGIFLVGDINKLFGVCDDCTHFEEDGIKEYSIDYLKEMEEITGYSFK